MVFQEVVDVLDIFPTGDVVLDKKLGLLACYFAAFRQIHHRRLDPFQVALAHF